MSNLQPAGRLHGIDALRAIAMILGIFLHSTIAYKQFPIPTWPHDRSYHHIAFDFFYMLIHTFRMPLFFLVAGFFCRFLLHKIGENDFILHRWKRIVLPFFVSLITLLPFTIFPFLVYRNTFFFQGDWSKNIYISCRQLLNWNGMAHLWFLYYLIIYYIVVLFSRRCLVFLGFSKVISSLNLAWQKMNWAAFFLFVFSLLCLFLILLQSSELFISVSTGIIPDTLYLSFYGLFFIIGWIVHIKPVLLNGFAKNAWVYLLPGIILAVFTFFMNSFQNEADEIKVSVVFYKFLLSLQVLFLVLGTIGIFLRYFKRESSFWRYISDASYWMYLVHLGLVAGIQLIISYSGIYGPFRFWIVLISTLFLTLATYHFFIRFTIVGEFLHGSRRRKRE